MLHGLTLSIGKTNDQSRLPGHWIYGTYIDESEHVVEAAGMPKTSTSG
jgi:hypothetical protein